MLYFLETPLVSIGERNKKYFYSLDDFKKESKNSRLSGVRYLKGLGSLSLDDWDYVMRNKKMTNIVKDKKSSAMLDMAFGKSSEARKAWLSSMG
jgi:DNA gyrase/topoisomerase IV subunit B